MSRFSRPAVFNTIDRTSDPIWVSHGLGIYIFRGTKIIHEVKVSRVRRLKLFDRNQKKNVIHSCAGTSILQGISNDGCIHFMTWTIWRGNESFGRLAGLFCRAMNRQEAESFFFSSYQLIMGTLRYSGIWPIRNQNISGVQYVFVNSRVNGMKCVL